MCRGTAGCIFIGSLTTQIPGMVLGRSIETCRPFLNLSFQPSHFSHGLSRKVRWQSADFIMSEFEPFFRWKYYPIYNVTFHVRSGARPYQSFPRRVYFIPTLRTSCWEPIWQYIEDFQGRSVLFRIWLKLQDIERLVRFGWATKNDVIFTTMSMK